MKPGYYEANSRALTFGEIYNFTSIISFPLAVIFCKIFKMDMGTYTYLPEILGNSVAKKEEVNPIVVDVLQPYADEFNSKGINTVFWQIDRKNIYLTNEMIGGGVSLYDGKGTLVTVMYVKSKNIKIPKIVKEKVITSCVSCDLSGNVILTINEAAGFKAPKFLKKKFVNLKSPFKIYEAHQLRFNVCDSLGLITNFDALNKTLDEFGMKNAEYKINRGLMKFVSDDPNFKDKFINLA